jgi:formylglycine-generating enzyme required for sulfatase activity
VKSALLNGNETLARQHAAKARSVLPGSPTVATMQREIASYSESSRADQIGVLVQAGLEAAQAGDFERLSELLEEARLVAREPGDYVDLESAFVRLQTRPGRQFRDTLSGSGAAGPEMVVMPAGEFTMGNVSKMLGTAKSERPAHRVLVDQPFAVGRTEITVGQFGAFVAATNYQTDAERGAMVQVLIGPQPQMVNGRSWRKDYLGGEAADSDPVVHVSWQDATQYLRWLTESSGRNYRLLSESEFEYVLRAGSTGRYLWDGNTPPQKTFNINGQLDEPPVVWGGKRAKVAVKRYGDSYFGPAPAVSFPANVFGIKHILGNVSEWVEDCYIGNFQGKGTGQHARQPGACQQRTVRGASWGSDKASLRASWRESAPADQGSNQIGFRVAMDLG